MADLSREQISDVIETWIALYYEYMDCTPISRLQCRDVIKLDDKCERSARCTSRYRYMQIFENKGAAMGCSSAHPHCQIWITDSLPDELALEGERMQKYRREHDGAHMLADYASLECKQKERVVFQNKAFVIVCPWWATWPFETMILPRKQRRALIDLDPDEVSLLAEAYQEITRRYDNLFQTIFPYGEHVPLLLLYVSQFN